MTLQSDYKFRTTFKQGAPSSDEGYEGEVTLRLTQSGVILYGKVRGVWYIVGRGLEQAGQGGSGQQGNEHFPSNIQLNDTFVLDKNVIKVNSSKSKTKDDAIKLNANSNVAGNLKVDEDLTVEGDLQVNGNDIAFDAAASSVSIDASAHNVAGARLTISGGNTTGGTTDNIAGGTLVLQGGRGKGSGAGGNISFKVANEGSSGSSLNNLVNALTIEDSRNIVCTGGTFSVVGDSGDTASLLIIADSEEDNADVWRIRATDSDLSNKLSISNKISGSHVAHLTIFPNATVASSSATFSGSLAVVVQLALQQEQYYGMNGYLMYLEEWQTDIIIEIYLMQMIPKDGILIQLWMEVTI